MSSVRVERPDGHAQLRSESAPAGGQEECLDFVRFCYRRRRVGWPELYDEMTLVASRGAFRGLGYAELADRGITFCLSNLPLLAALAERVAVEELNVHEPPAADDARVDPREVRQARETLESRLPVMMVAQPARG